MKSFVLLMLTLNAQTGEPLELAQVPIDGSLAPVTAAKCLEAQVAQGRHDAKDGKAVVFTCGNIVATETKPI